METCLTIIFALVFIGYISWAIISTLESDDNTKALRCIVYFLIGPVVILVLSVAISVIGGLVIVVAGVCFLISIVS